MKHLPRAEGRSVALAFIAYTLLLRLYPVTFRRRFAHEMIQVFRVSCHEAWQQHRGWGVLALWLMTLPDVVWTAGQERFARHKERQGVSMMARHWIRIGGITAFITIGCYILSAAYLLLLNTTTHTLAAISLNFAAQLTLLCVGSGLLAVQRDQWGRLFWGIAIAGGLLGSLLYNVTLYNPTRIHFGQPYRLLVGILQLVAFLSAIVASIFTWRAGSLGRWSALPFFALVWMFIARIINVYAFTIIFSSVAAADLSQRLLVENAIVTLPSWLLLAGIGIGLLQVAQADEAAPQPSDAVQ